MEVNDYDMEKCDIAWCPGCGDIMILKVLKETLAELQIAPEDLVMVSGIGQSATVRYGVQYWQLPDLVSKPQNYQPDHKFRFMVCQSLSVGQRYS